MFRKTTYGAKGELWYQTPTLKWWINIANDDQGKVSCMCISRGLLVITKGREGVLCYTREGNVMWKVSGKRPAMEWEINACGVTADEQGHLFVCDKENSCVHELFAGDGKHLGVVVRQGQDGVGKLYNSAYHQDSASLVVAHGNEPAAACCSIIPVAVPRMRVARPYKRAGLPVPWAHFLAECGLGNI